METESAYRENDIECSRNELTRSRVDLRKDEIKHGTGEVGVSSLLLLRRNCTKVLLEQRTGKSVARGHSQGHLCVSNHSLASAGGGRMRMQLP